jgi:molybdenum cofactor cytidylyltransferase
MLDMASPRIAGVVLAAGASRRFGAPKQLARLDGRPLLEHALAALAAVPAIDRTVVTLGAHADAIRAAVDLHGAEPVVVTGWEEGQAASLRAGVEAVAADADAVVVALGDQPRIAPAAIARIVAAWDVDGDVVAVRPRVGAVPGHPVLLARSLFPAVAALRGDVGAQALLRAATVLELDGDDTATADVDTPQQLAALARRRR